MILFNESTKTAKITLITDYAKSLKPVTKVVGVFDDLSKKQGENTLF